MRSSCKPTSKNGSPGGTTALPLGGLVFISIHLVAHEDQKYCHRNRLSEYSESLRQRNSRNRKTEEQIHKTLELVKTTGSSVANTLHCSTKTVRPQHIPCTFQWSVGTGVEDLDQNTINCSVCVLQGEGADPQPKSSS